MQKLTFRPLKASEIDCRIGMVSRQGNSVSVLLYKDARVDMSILDETVGPAGWQREHYECKGNLYCRVGINLGEGWIWKSDCGVESNTEAAKGESSDSFKRACVNWGIGRALYTAPRIWLNMDKGTFEKANVHVAEINYDRDYNEITGLVLVDGNNMIVYSWGANSVNSPKQQQKPMPQQQQQAQNPAPQHEAEPTIEQAISMAKACTSEQELTSVWSRFGTKYGRDVNFVNAIVSNPAHPNYGRSTKKA